MRAREFTISVPITITINGDDDPQVSAGDQQGQADDTELQQNPVMISPQQQEIELKKAELGKSSPVIDKLTQDHSVGTEPVAQDDVLSRLKELVNR
jgi:hypothetical protein